MSVLTLENVSFSYDQTPILNNISFTFEPGQIYAITGRSGTGKTTLLSLLAGLTVPTAGTIYYHDKNLASMNTYDFRRQQVGVIFQGFNLLTKLTAFENVLLSLELSNVSVLDKKEQVYNLLARVGIDREQANRRVLQLSGGQQQRVAIARALASQPDVILADEPTGNLDAETEASIIDIFKALADQGKCVILVTHTPAVAQAADHLIDLAQFKRK